MILDFLVTFLVAALAGLGVGSGGLLLIYLTLVREVEQLTSQGINLAFFIFAALASFFVNMRKKRIDPHTLIFITVFGVLGVAIGTAILPYIPPQIARKMLGVILILMSLFTLFFPRVKEFFKKMKDKK